MWNIWDICSIGSVMQNIFDLAKVKRFLTYYTFLKNEALFLKAPSFFLMTTFYACSGFLIWLFED